MKRIYAILVMICFAANPALAFKIIYGRDVVISQPVYEDLYIAGGNIVINAPVYGDLIVAGGTIHINDSIMNDILVAGGNITFNGFVGDDIRCAGGELRILSHVAGDIVTTGGTIIIDGNAVIGNLIIGGGEVTIDGKVLKDVKATTGKFVLNGQVLNDIDCRSGRITINGQVGGKAILAASSKILIGDSAAFRETVRYWSPNKVTFGQSLKGGNAVFDETLKIKYGKWYYLGFSAILGLLWYLGMAFLMIVLVQYLFSSTMKKAGNTFYESTLRSLGYGFLFWISVPVLAIIAFISLIGIPLGIILLVAYIILALLATVIISVVLANWVNSLANKHFKFWKLSILALGIFILLKVLTLTPFVGWIVMGALAFISFGAILLNINWRRRKTGPPIGS